MENKIANSIKETMNSLKETIVNAVNEIKEDIKANLSSFEEIKSNLRADLNALNEIGEITDDMSVAMEMATEDITDSCLSVEPLLDIIDPQEEEYIVVEDTASGEETEYPIN